MRCLGIVAGVAVAVGALTGCRAGPAQEPWADAVAPDVLAKMSLEYYWRSAALPIDRDAGERLRHLWRRDESLYALTSRNRLIAVNAVNGRVKWHYTVGVPALKVFAPCHADDVIRDAQAGVAVLAGSARDPDLKTFDAVVVNTLSTVLLIDRDTGELVRKLNLTFAANSPGTSDGDHFYVGSVKGWYRAVRLCDGLIEWTRATGDMISAAPVVYNRRLYVASQDKQFYAIQPGSLVRPRLWVQTTDGPLTAGVVVDERGCFVPSQDYRLY
ncbi:MAG: outer membrane protein assembly factor BamB family protein, partial [Planctomycetota bacterium]